jgi:uncharacterized membrane protein
METLFEFMRLLHILAGFIALIMFWIPLITQNGSKLHRNSGWIFTFAMLGVAISAMTLAIIRIAGWKESTSVQIEFAWFLMLIAWLSGSAAWHGLVVLQAKWWKQFPRRLNAITIFFASVLALGGVGVMIYGWMGENSLLQWFPVVAISLSVMQLNMLRKRTRTQLKVWRIGEHISGMVGCGIATITAFTVFAFPRLLGWESAPLWMWLLPIVILNPVIFFAIRKHARP